MDLSERRNTDLGGTLDLFRSRDSFSERRDTVSVRRNPLGGSCEALFGCREDVCVRRRWARANPTPSRRAIRRDDRRSWMGNARLKSDLICAQRLALSASHQATATRHAGGRATSRGPARRMVVPPSLCGMLRTASRHERPTSDDGAPAGSR